MDSFSVCKVRAREASRRFPGRPIYKNNVTCVLRGRSYVTLRSLGFTAFRKLYFLYVFFFFSVIILTARRFGGRRPGARTGSFRSEFAQDAKLLPNRCCTDM